MPQSVRQSEPNSSIPDRPLLLRGLYPATVTPFASDLTIDWPALEAHLRETAAAPGVAGLAVNGGLGEITQLSLEEQVEIVTLARRVVGPGQIVIAGVCGTNLGDLIEAGIAAKEAGADALLVLPPFDTRPYRRLAADAGIVRATFEELDRRIDLPLVVFQYPPQSGCAYPVAVLKSLAEIRNVVAIKVATAGDFDAYVAVWDALKDDLAILPGVDSPPLIDMLRHGAHGALIGISAIAPDLWARLLTLVEAGRMDEATALYDKVCKPLMASVFENQRPTRLTHEAASTKEALVQLGKMPSARVRLPAAGTTPEGQAAIAESLRSSDLITSHRSTATI